VRTIDATTATWLRESRAAAGRSRLVCFPHAGAGAAAYHGWAELLAPEVRVSVVQLPGREDRIREPRYDSVGPLLDDLLPVLAALDEPFAFFGHSMGALVAYEATRRLRDLALPQPTHLFVSGRQAPHVPDRDAHIARLPSEEFLRAVQTLNGFPAEVLADRELARLVEPTLRADFALCEGYRFTPGEPLDRPISAFGGTGDDVGRDDLDRWRSLTRCRFELRMLPGDHFFVAAQRHRVTAAILADLRENAAVGADGETAG
jgi:medium-chain acyl-[acyl-carrier-protein] hydrolase